MRSGVGNVRRTLFGTSNYEPMLDWLWSHVGLGKFTLPWNLGYHHPTLA
jgi:hypothetical protein